MTVDVTLMWKFETNTLELETFIAEMLMLTLPSL